MSENNKYDLRTPLLKFSENDEWTIADAAEGTSIMGAIGSGKTSGSGATIAKAFLRSGMGGLVMCAKPEERELWEGYTEATGRRDELIVVSPEPDTYNDDTFWRFNFLNYEMKREGRGGGHTENIVNLMTRIIEIAEGTHDIASKEQFWERAMRQMMRNAIDILALSQDNLTLNDLLRFIQTAPQNSDDATPSQAYQKQAADEGRALWWDTSFCAQSIIKAEENAKTPRQKNDFSVASNYWIHEFAPMSVRTRSGIISTFTSVADQLLHGVAWSMLASPEPTNIVPEMTYKDGAIIILDMPVQEFQVLGRVVQGIFKYMFQRSILRRDTKQYPRPVFLWADEAQNFVSSFDYQYQAVARSAKACTVYITQNISNYYSVLGGANSQSEAHAFLGNLQTKIWHANGDYASNQHASDTLSQAWQTAGSFGVSEGAGQTNSGGGSEVVQYKVLPSEFTTLRKGGHANNLEVEGIVFQGGRIWDATKDTHLKSIFKQG